MTLLWIALAIVAAIAVGIWIGIKSFESAVKEAIEDLMGIEDLTGRKTNEP